MLSCFENVRKKFIRGIVRVKNIFAIIMGKSMVNQFQITDMSGNELSGTTGVGFNSTGMYEAFKTRGRLFKIVFL